MPTNYLAPTANFVETTLNGSITDSAGTITLASTSNLQAPGYVVLDRVDANGTATPNAREVVSYTGISGNDLTGCTRGADNSTGRAHSSGAKVETMPTVGLWNSLSTIVASGFDSNGYLKAINSPASIAYAHLTRIVNANATVTSSLNVASASVVGLGITPVFTLIGSFSGPTTSLLPALPVPKTGQWGFVNLITRTVASGASAIIDINKNGTSIFDAGTRPYIAGGGTFYSSASIATKGFTRGDRITIDYDTTGGHVTDFLVTIAAD